MSQAKAQSSTRYSDAALKTAMIDEMLRADNWQGIEECMAIKPKLLKTFSRYADAALKAIKALEKTA